MQRLRFWGGRQGGRGSGKWSEGGVQLEVLERLFQHLLCYVQPESI